MIETARVRLLNILRWSEKYFKTDMVYLASGGFWLTLTKIAASLSSLALAIAFANFLDPEIYGIYKYVLSILSILTIATLPDIDLAFTRAVARGHEGDWKDLLRTKIRWGFFGAAGAAGAAGYYFLNDNSTLGTAFLMAAAFVPFMDSLSLYEDLLQGRRRFATLTWTGIGIRLIMTSALIAILFARPALFPVLLTYLFGWTVLRAGLLAYFIRTAPPNNARDATASSFGKHLSFMRGLNTAAGSVGSILLFQVSGGTALATFTLAIAPLEQIRGLFGIAETLLLPKMARDEWTPGSFGGFARRVMLFFVILSVGIGVYMLLAPFLFAFVFPQYLAAVPYSQAYAPTLPLSAAILLLGIVLRAKRELRKLYITNSISIASHLVLLPLGIYLAGIWGYIAGIYLIKLLQMASLVFLLFWARPKPNGADAGTFPDPL